MNSIILNGDIVTTLTPEDVRKYLSDRLGVNEEAIECGGATVTIPLKYMHYISPKVAGPGDTIKFTIIN